MKGLTTARMGAKFTLALSAAYLTNELLSEKTNKLVAKSGLWNKFAIGIGQVAISALVGAATCMFVG